MIPAESYIKFDSKLKQVETKKSLVKDAGEGLFAIKNITKGQPVVIYHGEKISQEDMFKMYMSEPEEYKLNNSLIKGTPNGFSIVGKRNNNLVLCGVCVNDIAKIECDLNNITKAALMTYAKTAKQCNLKTVDTLDYPVYVAAKSIKKGEELYAHYGIGYWLFHMGCPPEKISELNNLYDFQSFYQ